MSTILADIRALVSAPALRPVAPAARTWRDRAATPGAPLAVKQAIACKLWASLQVASALAGAV